MAKERLFFTGSNRIISDVRPSGLDMRVYACVSLHDGMSILKKSGRGCYATFATMTAEIGCDKADLSRALKRLVQWGYLVEERQQDRRRKTYRVTFHDAKSWANHQPSAGAIVGGDNGVYDGNSTTIYKHYSSLKGLDTLERKKLDSSEAARFALQAPVGEQCSNVGGHLARLERSINAGETIDCPAWDEWLWKAIEDDDPTIRHWALRLSEQLPNSVHED